MPVKKIDIYKIILLIITVLVAGMGILILFMPPSIFPDPSWGFQVMRGMQMGGGFNMLTNPSVNDISKSTSSFLTWWSPGQYLTPYFFRTIFGISTGHATALTVALGSICGLAGFYFFFKKAGFTSTIAAAALVFIILQEAFWVPYAYYNGGETLLFAFEGWFLYGCITFKKPDFKLILFVLLSGWIGFFCKSSFMWIYASGLLCLWIRFSTGSANIWLWLKNGILLGIPTILSLATIYMVYLSKGENPASMSDGFKLTFETIGFPLASPFLTGFSVDDLLNGLIFNDTQQFSHTQIVLILLSLIILSLTLIALILRYVTHKDYRLFIIVFYAMSILFFSYSFLRQAVISYEARHFRIIGLLIAPGLIYVVSKSKMFLRAAFLIICTVIGYTSLKYIIKTPEANKNSAHGNTGLSQQFIDQPSLNYILTLDKQNTNAIFVFISADIGLEIQHNRIITVNETGENMTPYLGHSGVIYMVLPADYTSKENDFMFKYFPGYKDFKATRLSKDYILYTAQ